MRVKHCSARDELVKRGVKNTAEVNKSSVLMIINTFVGGEKVKRDIKSQNIAELTDYWSKQKLRRREVK